MNALVVYDSLHGNTEEIARTIGGAIAGGARLVRAGEVDLAEMGAVDLLVVGSPTQGGRPTPAVQSFLGRAPDAAIKGIKVAAFDTRISTTLVGIFGYAAPRIAGALKRKGGTLVASPQGFFVKGTRGPLKEGELQRAAAWGKAFAG